MLFLVLSSIPIILAAHAITMADSPSTVATATLNINEKPINDSDNNYITIHMNRFFETKETTVTTIAIFVVLLIGITSIIIISIKLITQILPVKDNKIKTHKFHSEKHNKITNPNATENALPKTLIEAVNLNLNKPIIIEPKERIKEIANMIKQSEQAIKDNNYEEAKRLHLEAKKIYFNSNLDYEYKSKIYKQLIALNEHINKK